MVCDTATIDSEHALAITGKYEQGKKPNDNNVQFDESPQWAQFSCIEEELQPRKRVRETLAVGGVPTRSVSAEKEDSGLTNRLPAMIVSSSYDGTAKLWNSQTGECLRTFLAHDREEKKEVMLVVITKDGMRILTAHYDGTARMWSTTTGACLQIFTGSDDRLPDSTYEPWEPEGTTVGGLYSATFSPDEAFVLTASAHGMVRLWEVKSGTCLWAFRAHTNCYTRSAVFSPSGTHLATSSADMTARLWCIESRKLERTFTGHKGWLNTAVFSPDGESVLTSSADYTAKLWCINSGDCTGTFKGHSHFVRSAVFAPDGNRVLTCSSDWVAKVFDVKSFACEFTLRGHDYWVNTAVFSHDASLIVTSSRDHTMKIWCASSGKLLKNIGIVWNTWKSNGMHQGFIMSAVFVPHLENASDVSIEGLTIALDSPADAENTDDIRTNSAKKARFDSPARGLIAA